MTPEERVAALGISVPSPPAAAAAYTGWVRSGDLVFTAGQLPLAGGALLATGTLGAELDLAEGQRCARACAVNVLAQLAEAAGALSLVRRLVRLTVYVASTPTFADQHLVANGASELLAEVFGDAGRHARSAVGVPVLPLHAPVEVEAVAEVA